MDGNSAIIIIMICNTSLAMLCNACVQRPAPGITLLMMADCQIPVLSLKTRSEKLDSTLATTHRTHLRFHRPSLCCHGDGDCSMQYTL